MYNSAIFGLIAINFTLCSPIVTTWCEMYAEFAALTISSTKSVAVWVFVAIALCLNDLTIWVRLWKWFIMTNV